MYKEQDFKITKHVIDCIKNLYFVSWHFKYIMNDIYFLASRFEDISSNHIFW